MRKHPSHPAPSWPVPPHSAGSRLTSTDRRVKALCQHQWRPGRFPHNLPVVGSSPTRPTIARACAYLYDQTRRYFTAMVAGEVAEFTSGPPIRFHAASDLGVTVLVSRMFSADPVTLLLL